MSVLDAIGDTSMAQLQRLVPAGCAAIHAKLEWESPIELGQRDRKSVV